jgi:hypothetical protein
MISTVKPALAALLVVPFLNVFAQEPKLEPERIEALEKKLAEAKLQIAELHRTVESLSDALIQLKSSSLAQANRPLAVLDAEQPAERHDREFAHRILVPDLGGDERDETLTGRPELFVQSRFHAFPLQQATNKDIRPNFALTRMETRWSGRVSDRLGVGFELQYHPAPQGASFEIVNDAFLEYYAGHNLTIRAGQFVKPFGFDIQQSSSVREAPERGIFAGYFFPGQRDKGVMLIANLQKLGSHLHGTTLYAAVLNGNRFFDDNNRNVNYNFRLRKVFSSLPLAFGASAQLGTQILPPGMQGSARENLFGADLQFVWKRLGIRSEFVTGNMPSTLLNLEPEYAPTFLPGAQSTGAVAFANIHITRRNDIYGRFDWFRNDPVTSRSVRAWNVGYFRTISESGRVGVDYQWKNRLSYNDDRLNTRLQITWNVIY